MRLGRLEATFGTASRPYSPRRSFIPALSSLPWPANVSRRPAPRTASRPAFECPGAGTWWTRSSGPRFVARAPAS